MSETLSLLGVSVKVSVKTTPYPAQSAATAQLITPDAGAAVSQRLWITCEALYSPDPMLAGEPIAQQVRDLQLEGFRDAVIVMQVRGELTPDWLLQVDLTPTQDMLREWARWGDVSAIARLVSHTLSGTDLELSTASLQDATLHLFFSAPSRPTPNQHQVITTIVPVLEAIAPQQFSSQPIYKFS
ncbi:MAG: hypothetical protein HC890_06640 [Chloroflexaceae bacterium]|nr:hypothetical protein [Chloroflexaceae bacterium]